MVGVEFVNGIIRGWSGTYADVLAAREARARRIALVVKQLIRDIVLKIE
jgi:hypothetical protein